jgi:hypothetical protein
MYNGKLVSSKFVIERLYRRFRIDASVNYHDLVEEIGTALRHLKVPCWYVDKVTDGNKDLGHQDFIEIKNGRGKLPCDLFNITQSAAIVPSKKGAGVSAQGIVVNNLAYMDYNTGERCYIQNNTLCDLLQTCEETCVKPVNNSYHLVPMRWNTNSFYKGQHGTNIDFLSTSSVTYTVNDNYIFTNFSEGYVVMAYKAVPTDAEGLPLIPDNESVIDFVMWHLALVLYRPMFYESSISEGVFRDIESNYQLFFEKSKNEGKMPKSLDEWEVYKNIRMRTIPQINDHSSFFRNLQAPQEILLHPRPLSHWITPNAQI